MKITHLMVGTLICVLTSGAIQGMEGNAEGPSLKQTIATYFNAKKFLCFQLAKMLDTLQNPFRKCYQTLVPRQSTRIAKGPYPIFDNISAIFSATPVITRTATYIYACVEWIDEAFQGKEEPC